jgi:hypothetical protein
MQNYPELQQLSLIFGFFLLHQICLRGQSFDPPAGMPGSLAISHDSPKIRVWASRVISLNRGPKNCASADTSPATAGLKENCLGPALENGVISLGDGGSITLGFPVPAVDGPGPDLVVFENGFSDGFLELATVEVSSNGIDFIQFPGISETSTEIQAGPFDTLNARNLYNLAGKYRSGFGTGFDFSELPESPDLDRKSINFVRIRDVIGSIDPAFGTRDSEGRIINDPWPTEFESGGFDLDAVGLIHPEESSLPMIWPNVLSPGAGFSIIAQRIQEDWVFCSAAGALIMEIPAGTDMPIRLPAGIHSGVYFLSSPQQKKCRRILVQ